MTRNNILSERLHEVLHTFGARLQTREGRVKIVGGCVGLSRKLLRWTMLFYLLALLVQCLLMRFVGERNVFFAFCIYLPPLVWFLPALALLPLCMLVLEWRGLLVGTVGVVALLLFFFGLEIRGQSDLLALDPAARERQLVVLTNNRGQNLNQSMRGFKDAVKPDVMVFQESGGYSARYLADPGYAEFKHGRDVGEFSLVSKHPIISMEPVVVVVDAVPRMPGVSTTTVAVKESHVVAARCVINFQGQHVVIYNVHMPSPRDALRYHMRGPFLYGLLGVPGTLLGDKRAAIQRGWNQRIEMVRELIKRAEAESEPTLLAGDFNMPSAGYCKSLVNGTWGDGHDVRGSGFGFTFPGTSRNPLWLGGPGIRIDYVFFDPEKWRCIGAITEPDRESQHRAFVASLTLEKTTLGR